MIGAGMSSLIFLPTLRALSPNARPLGMSLVRYTTVSVWFAFAIAGALLVVAIVVFQ
jgi:hypothetical protein